MLNCMAIFFEKTKTTLSTHVLVFFSHIKLSFCFVLMEKNALAISYWIRLIDGLSISPIESMVLLFLLFQPNHISTKDYCFVVNFPCEKKEELLCLLF